MSFPPLLPAPTECTIHLGSSSTNQTSALQKISKIIDSQLKGLDLKHWSWDTKGKNPDDLISTFVGDFKGSSVSGSNSVEGSDSKAESTFTTSGMGISQGNVWSRAARRRRLHHILAKERGQQQEKPWTNIESDNINNNDAVNFGDDKSQPQNSLHSQETPTPTTDPKSNNQNRKRRRVGSDDDKLNYEAKHEAKTEKTCDDSKEDNNVNAHIFTNWKQGGNEERKEATDTANIFAFRISVCFESVSSPATANPNIKTNINTNINTKSKTDTHIPSAAAAAAAALAPKNSAPANDFANLFRPEDISNASKISEIEEDNGKNEVLVTIRWLYGYDRTVFESFCGMMRRTLLSSFSLSSSSSSLSTSPFCSSSHEKPQHPPHL